MILDNVFVLNLSLVLPIWLYRSPQIYLPGRYSEWNGRSKSKMPLQLDSIRFLSFFCVWQASSDRILVRLEKFAGIFVAFKIISSQRASMTAPSRLPSFFRNLSAQNQQQKVGSRLGVPLYFFSIAVFTLLNKIEPVRWPNIICFV